MYLLFYSIEIKVYMTEIKKGLVSVITVCYNAEKNLEETILSILNQTYSNIEYIITQLYTLMYQTKPLI